jgi:hypothetical protein
MKDEGRRMKKANSKMRRASSFILLALAFVFMLAWTWLRWPDPLVDFGRELYLPWQVSQGKVLYRDVAHFNGPLSVYFNALAFRVLGVSLRTIVVVNIAIAAAVFAMIWRLCSRATNRLSATVGALLFITLFMPIQLVDIGNYNWMTPYSHELTHGIALSLAALVVLSSHLARPRAWRAGLVGLLLGLIFLTKVEVVAAATPAMVAGMWLSRKRHPVAFVAGFALPPVVALALLGAPAVIDPWKYPLDARLAALPFYRWSMGTDAPLHNIVQMFAVPAKLFVSRDLALWQGAFRGLLPATLAIAVICATQVMRRRRRRARPRQVIRLAVAIFALLLLAKIALNVRIQHYGFALAMPAMLVTTTALLSLRRRLLLRVAVLVVVTVVVSVHLYVYATRFRDKPVVVAPDRPDMFRADPRGELVNAIVRLLNELPPSATVATLPQGAMVNYLSNRANPTPFITLMPPEVIMFGDDRIAMAYEHSPPDVIVLIDTDLSEYGYQSFDEVAPRTAAWMRANYELARTLPAPSTNLPGARILRRK